MGRYVLTTDGQLYRCDSGNSELYHYGVPGMKWGMRKAKVLQKKEKKLTKRFAKEDARYQKVAKKYNKMVAKGKTGKKFEKMQNKEILARAQKNKAKAKLDTVSNGLKATRKLIDSYANSPTTVSKLANSAINKGTAAASRLMNGKKK